MLWPDHEREREEMAEGVIGEYTEGEADQAEDEGGEKAPGEGGGRRVDDGVVELEKGYEGCDELLRKAELLDTLCGRLEMVIHTVYIFIIKTTGRLVISCWISLSP